MADMTIFNGWSDLEVGDKVRLCSGAEDKVIIIRCIQEIFGPKAKRETRGWFEYFLQQGQVWVRREEIEKAWWDT